MTNRPYAIAKHPVGTAVILALISLPIHYFLPVEWSQLLAALILCVIGGVFIGFASIDGRVEQLILETAVAVVFALFALISLKLNPALIPLGYIAHGLWDWAHNSPILDVRAPNWYIPLCAVYDILLGFGLWFLWYFI